MHSGTLFELGPDGYGYVLDLDEPGRAYAFCLNQLRDRPSRGTGLEGSTVVFGVDPDGRTIHSVQLAPAKN